MHDISFHIAMLHNHLAGLRIGFKCHGNEASLHAMKLVVASVLARRASCVLVAGCTHAELSDAGCRIDGVILPVPIAAENEKVLGTLACNQVRSSFPS